MYELIEMRSARIAISVRASRTLWVVAVLDMMAVAWMVAAGPWLSDASWLTRAMTLDGRHTLVLALASVAFTMLAALAMATQGFTSATRFQVGLIALAGMISVVALAGALSAILLLLTAALVLGFVTRPLLRR